MAVQLASFAHLATASHVLCAEHGDWVDAQTEAAQQQSRAPSAEPNVAQRQESAIDADHLHCPTMVLRWSTMPAVVAANALALAPFEQVVAPDQPLSHRRPALSFAPKQSPPA